MAANKFRKEVVFTFSDKDGDPLEVTTRPTLARVSAIESRFGAVTSLLQRFSRNEVSVGEITILVGQMINGVSGAPPIKELPDAVFEQGALTFAGPCVDFLLAAISAPEKPKAPDGEGNE